jgi:RNA polymerase sigma-70 factor (ECF subfamily)
MDLEINRTLVKNNTLRMDRSNKTVSTEAMEQEWLEVQAAQQDLRHFRPLYDRYFESIFRFIHRRTADESLSADICSQVFLSAMQKLKKYEFMQVPFSAWLFRIASNEVTQHFRESKKKRVISLEENHVMDLLDEITELSEEEEKRSRTLFFQSLQQLKSGDLELIELRFFEKRSFKEIAGILELTESNAKVRTYRILEKLRKQFENGRR